MIDKSGLFVAHPKKEYILELNVTNLEGMKDIAGKMIARRLRRRILYVPGREEDRGLCPRRLHDLERRHDTG